MLRPFNSAELTAIAGFAIVVGLLGIVVPVLPGLILIWLAIALWALLTGTAAGWIALTIATVVIALATVLRYLLPEKQLRSAGVPWTTSVAGVLGGIAGFFAIPVVGILVGFVLGIFIAEWIRLGSGALAWPSTRLALRAAGISMLIELGAAVLAALAWLVAVRLR